MKALRPNVLYAEAMSRIKTYVILAVAGGGIAIGVYLSFNGRPVLAV